MSSLMVAVACHVGAGDIDLKTYTFEPGDLGLDDWASASSEELEMKLRAAAAKRSRADGAWGDVTCFTHRLANQLMAAGEAMNAHAAHAGQTKHLQPLIDEIAKERGVDMTETESTELRLQAATPLEYVEVVNLPSGIDSNFMRELENRARSIGLCDFWPDYDGAGKPFFPDSPLD